METAHEKHTPFAVPATIYTYLLIGEKSKDGETYGFYNNSNGEWY